MSKNLEDEIVITKAQNGTTRALRTVTASTMIAQAGCEAQGQMSQVGCGKDLERLDLNWLVRAHESQVAPPKRSLDGHPELNWTGPAPCVASCRQSHPFAKNAKGCATRFDPAPILGGAIFQKSLLHSSNGIHPVEPQSPFGQTSNL